MKTVKNIKELNVSIDKLYKNDCQINVHFSNSKHIFYVLLKNIKDEVDCKLSSYSANLWTRTKAGTEFRKYKRIQDLQTAIKKEINKKIDISGDISFSVCNNIRYL